MQANVSPLDGLPLAEAVRVRAESEPPEHELMAGGVSNAGSASVRLTL